MLRIKLKSGLVCELTLRVNRHSNGQESPLCHHYVLYHLVRWTRLSGPQEPPSDLSTSRPSPKMDKGKAKMSEYEDDRFDDNESIHSLDCEFGGFDVPIGAKKALISSNGKLYCSTREKNLVSRFG